jgi:hypothetical protein
MRKNGFFFRNLQEKLFWSYGGGGGLIWGQKWTNTKIEHFTKNGSKSSLLSIFHMVKAQNDRN